MRKKKGRRKEAEAGDEEEIQGERKKKGL